jgi:hypothetical protein
LKRSTGLRRGKPLKRTAGLKRTGRINPRSKKRAAEMPERNAFTVALTTEHPGCQIAQAGCTGRSVEVHEALKRSHGGAIVPGEQADRQGQVFFATCRNCNEWVEAHPREALEKGNANRS